jgi:hypothetical protein
MVELRWAVPEGTTTEAPRLQYRNWGEWPAAAGPWQDVPRVVVPDLAASPAPAEQDATCSHRYVRDDEHPTYHCCQKCGKVTREPRNG